MAFDDITNKNKSSTSKIYIPGLKGDPASDSKTGTEQEFDPLRDLESSLGAIANKNPRLTGSADRTEARCADLKAILEISKAVNSSLVLDDILRIVMKRAIELLQAERGFLMLLDDQGRLQFRTAHNLYNENMNEADLKISESVPSEVVNTGKPVFASDAQADKRFAKQESILELHLRSIMCVPLKVRDRIIGVVYLDNSSDSKIFLQSDLYLFELFAEQAAIAIENAKLYESVLSLKKYNERVVDKTPVGLVATDHDLRVTSLNSVAAEILGGPDVEPVRYDPQKAMTSFVSIWPEKARDRWEQIAREVLSSGEAYQDNKYYHQVGNEQKVLSVKLSLLDDADRDNTGIITVIEDITDKVLLENYVVMSERLVARGEMAAAIGHELNNYLTIASNNAELMKLNIRRDDTGKIEKNANAILDSITKIKRFTDGLMDYSTLEAEFVEYQISDLIEELLFSVRPQKNVRSTTIEVDVAIDMPPVELDVGQMHQVLLNLINNAVDALRDKPETKGRIHISARYDPESQEVTIEVSDNGPGIKTEDLEKIFEPRFTRKTNGHGLGLSNCKRILDSHHGTITAISDGCDGSTFRLTMPVRQPKSSETD